MIPQRKFISYFALGKRFIITHFKFLNEKRKSCLVQFLHNTINHICPSCWFATINLKFKSNIYSFNGLVLVFLDTPHKRTGKFWLSLQMVGLLIISHQSFFIIDITIPVKYNAVNNMFNKIKILSWPKV